MPKSISPGETHRQRRHRQPAGSGLRISFGFRVSNFGFLTKPRSILTLAVGVILVWLSGCSTAPPSPDQQVAKEQKFDLKAALKEKKRIDQHFAELLPNARNQPLLFAEWDAMLQPKKTKFGTFALTEQKILEYLGKPESTFTADIIAGSVETWVYPNYVRTPKAGKTGTLLVSFKSRLVFVVSTPDE